MSGGHFVAHGSAATPVADSAGGRRGRSLVGRRSADQWERRSAHGRCLMTLQCCRRAAGKMAAGGVKWRPGMSRGGPAADAGGRGGTRVGRRTSWEVLDARGRRRRQLAYAVGVGDTCNALPLVICANPGHWLRSDVSVMAAALLFTCGE